MRTHRGKEGCSVWHFTSSLAATHTWLQAVFVAGSALEGFEGIREAVAKHGHLAAMAHRARNEGKVPTGLAHLGMLYPLGKLDIFIFLPRAHVAAQFGTNDYLHT